jgi:hypothetical protein
LIDKTDSWYHDLLVITSKGYLYRITPSGTFTLIFQDNDETTYFNCFITIPYLSRYRHLAGKALVSLKNTPTLYIINNKGIVEDKITLDTTIEDIDMITLNAHLLSITESNDLMSADASQLKNNVGDILLTQSNNNNKNNIVILK